jgi:DNA-directed RNA polymerase subunit F
MTDERKVQLGFEVDASGAKKGFDEVTRSAKSMADNVAKASKPASESVDKIGSGGDAAAKKLERSTQSMIASIQRTTAAMEAGDKTTSKYFQTLASQRGISSEALRPYLAQLDAAKAKQDAATSSLDKMGVSANFLRSMLVSLGGVLSVTAITAWATGVIASAAALDDLADATGSSVEELSRLANIARISGADFGTIDAAIKKLAVGMSGVDEESSKAGKALALLGVQSRDPAQALNEVALKFAGYADGANKAALAVAIFGRSGASLLPVLKDIAENQGIASTVTAQQAKAAEDLEKSWRRLGVESVTLKNALLDNIVPALTTTITSFNLARAAGMGFFDALKNAGNYDLVGTQKRVMEIESEIRKNEKVVQDYAARGMKAPADTIQKKVDELKKESAFLQSVLNTLIDKMPERTPQSARPDAPSLPGGNAAKQKIADYRDEIQKLNDEMLKLSGASGGYSHLIAANEKYQADLRAGKAINIAQVQTLMQTAVATDELAASTKNWAEAEKEAGDYAKQVAKDRAEYEKQVEASKESVRALVDNLEQETRTLGQSNEERELSINLLKLENSGLDKSSEEYANLEQRIRAAAEAKKVFAAQKTLADDFKKTADKISDSLTDALLRGFEAGKDFGKNFVDTLYNLFRTLVLRPVISAIIAPVSGGIASMVSGGAGASTGGSMLSAGGSLLGGLGNFSGGFSGALTNIGVEGIIGGTATNFAGIAGSLGAGNIMGAVGLAAPYLMAAVAIGSLVKGFLDSKKGGPKTGGYGLAGSISGVNRGDLFTPNQADGAATTIAQTTLSAYKQTLAALGGSGSGGFDIGYNSDPQGTAPNQLGVRAMVNGQQVYGYSAGDSLGRDDAALEAAINLESKRALLAALQASDLPDQIAAVFNSIAASGANAETIDNLLAFGSAMNVVIEAISGDVAADATDIWERSQRTTIQVLADMGAEVIDLANSMDGTVGSMQDLATATTNYRQAVVQTLLTLKQMKVDIDALFAGTRESLTIYGMSPLDTYNYYRNDADAAYAELQTTTDPARARTLANVINNDILAAFNALPDADKLTMRAPLLTFLNDVNALVTGFGAPQTGNSVIDRIWDIVVNGTVDPFAAANQSLDGAATKFGTAADDSVVASINMNTAVNNFSVSVNSFTASVNRLASAMPSEVGG